MKKIARHIGCVSSQPQQVMLLKSLLSIAGDRADSDNIWMYSDSGHRDAIVMDLDDECQEDVVGDVVVAMSRDVAALDGRKFTLQKPLRSKDVVHLLELLDRHIGESAETGKSLIDDEADSTQGDYGLDAILALSRRNDGNVLLIDFDGARAFLDVRKQRIFLDGDFSFAVVAGSKKFSVAEAQSLPSGGHVGMSLADFFYEYTLSARKAFLVDGLSPDAKYYIRQWPQFLNPSNTKSLIKVSAYFSKRKSTINSAAQDLLVGARQIQAYLNAAYVQRLLMMESDGMGATGAGGGVVEVAATRVDASQGLFGRIRRKLGL